VARYSPWEILLAWIPNSDGTPPPYPHPCIYLGESPTVPGGILVLGITSDMNRRVADYSIELPWAPSGVCETGLDRPSIAQALWTGHIMPETVRKVLGFTPRPQQFDIAKAIALRHKRQRSREP
jgi:hypothetical protein